MVEPQQATSPETRLAPLALPDNPYGPWAARFFTGLGILDLAACVVALAFGTFFLDVNAFLYLWIGRRLSQRREGFRIFALVMVWLNWAVGLLFLILLALGHGDGFELNGRPAPIYLSLIFSLTLLVVFSSLLFCLMHPKTKRAFRYERCLREGLCPNCEYDLRGNQSGICPECGQAVPEPLRDLPTPEPAQEPLEPASPRSSS